MGPFLGQVGLLFLLYFVHRCCGKHQTVPYCCTYHPFFSQARLFAFLKADYAVYRCVIPRAQFRVLSISKASFSSHDVVSVVGPVTHTQKHVASHLCRPPSANQGALKIHAFEADITRNYALGHCLPVFEGSCFYWNGVYKVSRDLPVSLLGVMGCCRTCNNVYSGGQCFHVHSLLSLHLRE